VSDGQKVRFERGAFDVDQKAAKLIQNHDLGQLLGIFDNLEDAEAGLEFEAVLADTSAGRDAVALLKAGAYDAVSVGANPVKFTTDPEGVMTVTEAQLIELSLVPIPAFSEAVITEIAAEAPADADEQGEQDPADHTDNTEQENLEMSEAKTEAQPIEAEATVPTHPVVYAAQRPELPSAVDYIAAMVKGGHEFDAMRKRVHAAAPEIGTADTAGILPTPILGPVYNNFIGNRPVVDAIGARAMPGGGKVFIRPEVTTHTSIAEQAAEFDTLQSGTLVVTDNQVTKKTFGGYVQISEQDLDWTDPAVLSIVLDDLGRVYANQTDNFAADQLVSGATVTKAFADFGTVSDSEAWVAAVYYAAKTILTGSNGNLPTHMFIAPDVFEMIGKLVDDSDRPLFPQVGPMNAYGTMSPGSAEAVAFGLRVVVDRNFADGTFIVGDASGYEIFEQQKGAISVDVPELLARTLAWRGYFATLMIDASKFVKFT